MMLFSSIARITLIILLVPLILPSKSASGDDQGFVYLDLKEKRQELEDFISSKAASIVHVTAYDEAGDVVAEGPGVFVSSDGKVITNAGTIDDAFSASVASIDNIFENVIVEGIDQEHDLALLKINAAAKSPVRVAERVNEVKQNDSVHVIYLSHGRKKSYSPATVVNIDKRNGYIEIEKGVSILSYPDASRGAVFDLRGRFIGITRRTIPEDRVFGGTPIPN